MGLEHQLFAYGFYDQGLDTLTFNHFSTAKFSLYATAFNKPNVTEPISFPMKLQND